MDRRQEEMEGEIFMDGIVVKRGRRRNRKGWSGEYLEGGCEINGTGGGKDKMDCRELLGRGRMERSRTEEVKWSWKIDKRRGGITVR